jgi:hypothetical protein
MPPKYSNPDDARRASQRIRALAHLLDGAFQIPGTSLRVGLDPIIGLLPVAGDLLSASLALYIVYEGWRLGADRDTLAQMLANVAIDTAVGLVPAAGDLFDAAFQANLRNLELLGITHDSPPLLRATPH